MPKKSKFEKFNWNGIRCSVKCVDVYDGDTITVEADFRKLMKKYYKSEHHSKIDQLPYQPVFLHCRMAGYNSAEVSKCTDAEKVIGLEAKKYMTDLVLGKSLLCHFLDKGEGILIKLKTTDPYGRPIADMHLINDDGKEGLYINEDMIKSGHAAPYDGRGPKKY
jgi:endonuclease YncB( thermonuclease family)